MWYWSKFRQYIITSVYMSVRLNPSGKSPETYMVLNCEPFYLIKDYFL